MYVSLSNLYTNLMEPDPDKAAEIEPDWPPVFCTGLWLPTDDQSRGLDYKKKQYYM